MDSENVFISLQSGCNQGSMAQKKEDSQADATAPTIQSPPTQTHTLKHTHTHMRARSQMGKGKAVALPT